MTAILDSRTTSCRGRSARGRRRMPAMDSIGQKAADDYHRLVRDETALVQEMEAGFFERMRAANLTFGGRILCPFIRPGFVAPKDYEDIRGVCRGITAAIRRSSQASAGPLGSRRPHPRGAGPRRHRPGLRAIVADLPPGLVPHASAYQFVELNAETPAGIAYAEVLADDLPGAARFAGSRNVIASGRFRSRERLLETLTSLLPGAGRAGAADPASPSWTTTGCRPARSTTSSGSIFEATGFPVHRLRPAATDLREVAACATAGRMIDIVYKRLLVNELLEKAGELRPLLQAARERAVTIVNPFRCKPIHKKAIFAVLTDEELQRLFTQSSGGDRDPRAVDPARAGGADHLRGRAIDLPTFIREQRDSLVMKPNDEYGGKGVFIGWETSEAEWDRALDGALQTPYVVQWKVELLRQSFPALSPEVELPRLRRGSEPLPVQRRGRGLPDAAFGDVPGERDVRRRPGPWLPGRSRLTGCRRGNTATRSSGTARHVH